MRPLPRLKRLQGGSPERLAEAVPPTARCVYSARPHWTGAREAEGDGLLNRCTGYSLYRGFESLPVRFEPKNGSLREACLGSCVQGGFRRPCRLKRIRGLRPRLRIADFGLRPKFESLRV